MTPEQALQQAQDGQLRAVYLLLGEEQYWHTRVTRALREASLAGGIAGLNDDTFNAADTQAKAVLSVCQTVPMMGKRRFVLVRAIDRWEGSDSQLDALTAYLQSPCDSTVLVLAADKLDLRRKTWARAKKDGLIVECDSPKAAALPSFLQNAAKTRGNRLGRTTADLLATLIGSDLAQLDSVVERLSLFVGTGNEIDDDAVARCLEITRPATVWELVGAVGRRDAGASLTALGKVVDANESEIRLVGLLAWSARQLIRFSAARAEGLSVQDAAKRAGAPPFKGNELAEQARRVSSAELASWLEALARADLDLKGGSKRPAKAVLEEAILGLCRTPARARATAG